MDSRAWCGHAALVSMLLLLLVLPHGGFALATTGSESEFTTDSADALVELTQANFNDYLRNNGSLLVQL
jgi:hypothetical protein